MPASDMCHAGWLRLISDDASCQQMTPCRGVCDELYIISDSITPNPHDIDITTVQ